MSEKHLYVRAGKVIDDVRAIAREHGYAVAVHGSLRRERDIDLLAAPWVKNAHAPRTLKDCPAYVDLSVMPRMLASRQVA